MDTAALKMAGKRVSGVQSVLNSSGIIVIIISWSIIPVTVGFTGAGECWRQWWRRKEDRESSMCGGVEADSVTPFLLFLLLLLLFPPPPYCILFLPPSLPQCQCLCFLSPFLALCHPHRFIFPLLCIFSGKGEACPSIRVEEEEPLRKRPSGYKASSEHKQRSPTTHYTHTHTHIHTHTHTHL